MTSKSIVPMSVGGGDFDAAAAAAAVVVDGIEWLRVIVFVKMFSIVLFVLIDGENESLESTIS